MKPITEQERQSLIEYGTLFNTTGTKGKMNRLVAIALASLTAVPVAVTDISEINDLKNEGWIGNFLAPEFQGVDSEDRVYLYTAPPVPVIKLPNPQDIPDGYHLQSCMATVQWYQQELERLNGLGE